MEGSSRGVRGGGKGEQNDMIQSMGYEHFKRNKCRLMEGEQNDLIHCMSYEHLKCNKCRLVRISIFNLLRSS